MKERESGRSPFWRYAAISVPLILGTGFLIGRLSNSGYGNDWFDALAKPATMPPGWAFGAAWSMLYIALGLSLALVLAAPRQRGRRFALGLFAAQMLLNFSWSPVFFGMNEARPALLIIVTMLALSIAIVFLFRRIDRRANWLMLPYLAWLAFASHLNFEIIQLNPGA
ncbi:MAG TPA: TspO/MBR family protein [Allosphingosinicella sp.]|nr:TspO/MBR family protein [Allosphingosinicella sp.]